MTKKRKQKRTVVHPINPGKPNHTERTFEPYPVQCWIDEETK